MHRTVLGPGRGDDGVEVLRGYWHEPRKDRGRDYETLEEAHERTLAFGGAAFGLQASLTVFSKLVMAE